MPEKILLYGATGYTGRRIARELHRMDASFVLAGRNEAKLKRLAEELGGAEVRVANADGKLEGLADGAAVMISTVGPFELYGEAAVAESLRAGAHFCDTTGEQGYMRRVIDRFDRGARERGLTVLNAQAFEYAIGYCLGGALLEESPDTHTVDVFNRVVHFGTSRGTKKSALRAGGGEALILRDGRLVDCGVSLSPAEVVWPDEEKLFAAPFPGGEALHFPRMAPQLRNVTTNIILPSFAARAMGALFALRPLLRSFQGSALQGWLERRIDNGREGPTDEEARSVQWTVFARARGPNGERLARADGTDVYGITGTIAALGAILLADGQSRASGVVCTAAAFDPIGFLDRLASHGVTYSVGSR